mmetsp:Transcript_122342/g.228630  ORF Transcript_122342/g.228630 Transcript_122342/m.228630 type:complete len:811 (-) Transcript_122342:53-2485(-)
MMTTLFLVLATLLGRGDGRRMNIASEPTRYRRLHREWENVTPVAEKQRNRQAGVADPFQDLRRLLVDFHPRAAWQAPSARPWRAPVRSLQSRGTALVMKGSVQADAITATVEAQAGRGHENVEAVGAETEHRNETQAASAASTSAEVNSSEALSAALDALEDDIREVFPWQDSDQQSYSSKSARKSQTLRDLEGLALEARGFVVGVRQQLAELRDNVVEKVKLEAAAAASIADFAVRKLALETLSIPALQARPANSSEDSASAARAKAMPFASRLLQIKRKRAEGQSENGANSNGEAGLLLASEDESEWAKQAAKQREGVEEAVNVVKEASQWAAAFVIAVTSGVSEALLGDTKGKGKGVQKQQASPTSVAPTAVQLPQLSTITSRARTVGSALQNAAAATIATTRADYASYLQLKRRGQLPTLLEEFQSLAPPALAGLQPQKPKLLGSLELGKSATKLRERIEFEGAVKQLRLAAAVGNRAVKDSGDALVFGALPAVSAVGKVAGRRLSYAVPQLEMFSAPAIEKSASAQPSSLAPGVGAGKGTAGLVREVAQQLAVEYAASAQVGAQAGILPDLVKAVGGPTRQIFRSVVDVLPAVAPAKLQAATVGKGLVAEQRSSISATMNKEYTRPRGPSAVLQLAATLGPQVGLSKKTMQNLLNQYVADASDVSSSSGMGNVVLDNGEVVPIDGPVTRMLADEDLEAVPDRASAEEECDVIMDVDCERLEEEKEDTVAEQIVAAIDLIALTAEVGADTISPAVERATDVLTTSTGIDDWKVLSSLQPEAGDRRQRSETARQELLETLTKLLERE